MAPLFNHSIDSWDDTESVQILNGENKVVLQVLPEFGGRLNHLAFSIEDKHIDIIDGHASLNALKGDRYFKNCHLAPFPNRLNNGRFQFKNTEYHLPRNSEGGCAAIHGFIFDKPFSVTSVNSWEQGADVSLQYKYSGDVNGFPFPFNIRFIYTMIGANRFRCGTRIRNTGVSQLPIGTGWHHTFKFPSGVTDILLKIPSSKSIELNKYLFPTGAIKDNLEFSKFIPVGKKKLDNCYKLNGEGDCIAEVIDHSRKFKLQLNQSSLPARYEYLQVFTHPSRMALAIEPMTCNIDALNNGDGLILLEVDEELELNYEIMAKPI